ncbi:MAG: hypothetical protein JNL60_02830 [Bacteroidia bacterium]|nr:hypothetical protein [Bacteroidia bacterium]
MKKAFLVMLALVLCYSCKEQAQQQPGLKIEDGFYEVLYIDSTGAVETKKPGQALLGLDTVFNTGDRRQVIIDVSDYVPLEMEGDPKKEQQTDAKKLLSVTLSKNATEKMRRFTATRVMKHVAIVIDGKVITMHKVREAINGPGLQITRCDDNACEYLFVKMKQQ